MCTSTHAPERKRANWLSPVRATYPTTAVNQARNKWNGATVSPWNLRSGNRPVTSRRPILARCVKACQNSTPAEIEAGRPKTENGGKRLNYWLTDFSPLRVKALQAFLVQFILAWHTRDGSILRNGEYHVEVREWLEIVEIFCRNCAGMTCQLLCHKIATFSQFQVHSSIPQAM